MTGSTTPSEVTAAQSAYERTLQTEALELVIETLIIQHREAIDEARRIGARVTTAIAVATALLVIAAGSFIGVVIGVG